MTRASHGEVVVVSHLQRPDRPVTQQTPMCEGQVRTREKVSKGSGQQGHLACSGHSSHSSISRPMGPAVMNVPLDPGDSCTNYLSLQGTSTGESSNRCVNGLTKEVGRQSAEMGDKRLWIWNTRYNHSKDKLVMAKTLDITQPQTMEWYLHKALLKRSLYCLLTRTSSFLLIYQMVTLSPSVLNMVITEIGLRFNERLIVGIS